MNGQSNNVVETILVVCFTVFMLIVNNKNVYGQEVKMEYTCKRYTLYDGLAQMQVMSLYQDRKGYLWCTTKAGLSRFDGKNFKNFIHNETDPNNFDILTFGENSKGNLFLFGRYGISQISGDSTKFLKYPEGYIGWTRLKKSKIAALWEVAEKEACYENSSSILNYENPDSLFLIRPNVKLGKIIYFDEEDKNLIWQTDFDSIYVSDLRTHQILKAFKNPGNITNIIKNKDCIFGTSDDISIFKLVDNNFKLVVETHLRDEWFKVIPTPDNIAFIIKTATELYYCKNEIVPIKRSFTSIRDILFDEEENLWVATEEGLYNFFQLNFINYSFGMGSKDWVWSVIEDDRQNMWFASYQNGLWKWDGKTVTDYTQLLNSKIQAHVKSYPPSFYRYYMGASQNGSAIYFPTECNILKYDHNKFFPLEDLPDLPFQITKNLPGNTLACGGYPGLYLLKSDRVVKHWNRNDLKISSVLNVETDKNNQILAVGKGGIAVIRGDSVTNYNTKGCLGSYSTAKDYKNNIWIGGIENVNLYNGDSLIHVTEKREEAFYSLLFVQPHYLLLGGLKGIYVVNLEDYYRNGTFEMLLYGQRSGFTGIECGQNGFFTDSEGMVWIPTSDYVTSFEPGNLINKEVMPPRIYVKSEVSADNILWEDLMGEKETNILKFNNNNVRFKVDAVSFANIGNIRFYFKLNGVQDKWSEPSETGEITFYKLRPGKYRFSAKADPGISKATSGVKVIDFEIEKPFWLKGWFFTVMVILMLAVIGTIVFFFRKAAIKKAVTQQRLIQLRSEALSAQLDPHFVMNCLNNINGLINAGYKTQATDYIVKFSKLLRVILQSVKKEIITLSDELDMVEKYMQLELLRCNHCFTYQIILPENYSIQNIMVPPMILQPLVENSIKHGFENGKMQDSWIKIKVEVQNKELQIIISDNGRGIQNESVPFGTGLGTKITRERIDLLQKKSNIEFTIKNQEPGVEVSFKIPLVLNFGDAPD